jgi:rhamnulokinase
MPTHAYLAVDLGAESGRVLRGILADGRLTLEEVARFPTGMVHIHGHHYWNLLRLYEAMRDGFKTAAASGPAPESIGVDTWGVDFVLLAEDGSLLGQPVAYRDSRTDGIMERLFPTLSAQKIYAHTGIQFMQFNTIFQLFALAKARSPLLPAARDLLLVPDYFNYLFTGVKVSEFSDASTTQLLNVRTGQWDEELIRAVGIDPAIFQKIVPPGTIIGPITPELREETGLGPIPVVAPATHDTGSAIAAVPAAGDENWAYISSGTWSLMGIETREPVTSEEARAHNFTNEGGVDGTTRFLTNIAGLWLVQRLRAGFAETLGYGELTRLAGEAAPFASLINPDDARFLKPASMPDAFAALCRETGQPVPATPGAFIRCALESLALRYRACLDALRTVQPNPIHRIHIVGGGTQNQLLNQMTADACGVPVVAGPVEATAIGNLVIQARALGHIGSLAEARAIIRQSFPVEEYQPTGRAAWDAAYEKFQALRGK